MNEIIERIRLLPREQLSDWREAHGTGGDEPLSLRWKTSPMWTPEHRDAVAAALRDWVLEQSDARVVLRTVTRADRRVAVWLVCAVARTALRYVPAGEDRPRLAIETAERWVRGAATKEECGGAADAAAANAAASAAADAADANAAADAAAAAAYAAYAANDANASARAVSYEAADAAAYAAAALWTAARNSALRDLCQTIAAAVRDAVDAAAEGYE